MAEDQPLQASQIIDPDCVPELICDGNVNVHFINERGILTFTHPRPQPGPMFEGTVIFDLIVRARIALTADNLRALRDLLTTVLDAPEAQRMPATGGATKH